MKDRRPKAGAGMKAGNWVVAIILALACWIVSVLIIGIILAGCAPRHDPYLAVRFEAFNDSVQDGLADCLADPNACRPTLELMAGELEVWTEIYTDPNL